MKKILKYILDCTIASILVFIIMWILGVIFSINSLKPISDYISDFKITDYAYSKLRDNRFQIDTNILIINTSGENLNSIIYLSEYINSISNNSSIIGIILDNQIDFKSDIFEKLYNNNIKSQNYVLGFDFTQDNSFKNQSDSIQNNFNIQSGFTNIFETQNKKYNFTLREFSIKDSLHESFGALILKKYNSKSYEKLIQRQNKLERIDFSGNWEKFININLSDINNIDPYLFSKKIILFGEFETESSRFDLRKLYFTPLNERTGGRSFPDMYPVIVQANIISTLTREAYFSTFSSFINNILIFTLIFMNMIFFKFLSNKSKVWYEPGTLLVFVIESIGLLFLSVILFHNYYFELNSGVYIFASALSVPVAEGWFESLKPISIKLFNSIYKKLKFIIHS